MVNSENVVLGVFWLAKPVLFVCFCYNKRCELGRVAGSNRGGVSTLWLIRVISGSDVVVLDQCKSCAQGPAKLEGRPKLKVCSVVTQKSELVNCQNGKCKSLLIFVLDQPILAP